MSALRIETCELSTMVRKNGHSRYIVAEELQAAGVFAGPALHRAAEAEPAGQGHAALGPGEDPGYGAQLRDFAGAARVARDGCRC